MRRVPIRMKLAGALAVPLAALVVVTSLEVVKSAREARSVRAQTQLAEASVGPLGLLSRIEDERNAAAVHILGQEESFALPNEDLASTRVAVDEAILAFRREVQARGTDIAEAYAPALEKTTDLERLRAETDRVPEEQRTLANIEAVDVIFGGYTAMMRPFFDANKRVALAIDEPELRRGAELADLCARQTDILANLVRDLLLAAVGGEAPDGLNTPAEIATISRRLAELRANEQLIVTKATGAYRPLAEDLFANEAVIKFPEVVDSALATGNVDLDDVITYSAGDDPETFGYTIFRRATTNTLSARADELEAAASARQRWFAVLAAIAVLLAALVTWLVSRSITRPLRSLTHQAKDMAERKLPDAVADILDTPLGEDVSVPTVEPVDVTTRDEVADVAVALNTVQDTALDLAVEQAVLRRNIADSFVNLGRRNQSLLGRQLDFITELESNETDHETLANLFRLDHLATRMRRNAESLLVLAGIDPPRTWAAPVRVTDVIRAALGEVEDYQRVSVRGVETATIVGAAAADLAHLVAELVENALVFSPPDQTVDIRGRARPDGYTLAVVDSGLGMPATDIAAANRRLAGAESFTIAPSRYLGHYVAGNLASRHGIGVRLDIGPGGGVTATVDLPASMLTNDDDAALASPVTDPHGMRALPAVNMPPPIGQEAQTSGQLAWEPAADGWRVDEPPVPAAAPFVPPTLVPPPPPAMPTRTQSGLVKRAPRNGTGATTAAEQLSSDLLDTLSRHTANLHIDQPAGLPDVPDDASRPGLWGRSGAPLSRPRVPEPPADWPAPGPLPPPPAGDWPAPGLTMPAAQPAAVPADPFDPDATLGVPAVGEGGETASGLTRRVRGAQLPRTQPLNLRRPEHGPERDDPGPAGAAGREAPERTAEQRRSADDVYGFLTAFTAGVKRGLHDDG